MLNNLSIYPNPVKDKIQVSVGSGYSLQQVNLYTFLGQFIKSTTTTTLELSNHSSGVYLLEVITNKGKATKKIIIE